MRYRATTSLFAVFVLAGTFTSWHAALADISPVGTAFTYQGRLLQAGEPVSGPVDLVFRLYEQEVGGAEIGTLVADDFPISEDGLFTIDLDFGEGVFTGEQRWLEVDVNTVTLSPRQPLLPAPYAIIATTVSNVPARGLVGHYGGITGVGTLDSLLVAGNVGVGTLAPNPAAQMHVRSETGSFGVFAHQTKESGVSSGVFGRSDSTAGRGVIGLASALEGQATGVQGESTSTNGRGVFGSATAVTGQTSGVRGHSASSAGHGMFGLATSVTGTTTGVRGESVSNAGRGIVGVASHGEGSTFGGLFDSHSRAGTGLLGVASNPAGTTIGVGGQVNSSDGFASYFIGPVGSRNYFQRSVGIGTEHPRQQLSIGANLDLYSGSSNSPTRPSVRGSGFDNLILSASHSGATFINHDGGTGGVRFHNGASGLANELARITPDGRLGIGTSNPQHLLHLRSDSTSLLIQNTSSSPAYLRFRRSGDGPNDHYIAVGSVGQMVMRVGGTDRVWIRNDGRVGIGTNTPQTQLHVAGTMRSNVIEITGADLAEEFPFSEQVEQGMVVAIDPDRPGKLQLARGAYNPCVAGIIAGANDFSTGVVLGRDSGNEYAAPVALTGRVYVWCDATDHAIAPGDMLTTSSRPGHAMKAVDRDRAFGAVIGKAMGGLERGEVGLVLVLVNLQ